MIKYYQRKAKLNNQFEKVIYNVALLWVSLSNIRRIKRLIDFLYALNEKLKSNIELISDANAFNQ